MSGVELVVDQDNSTRVDAAFDDVSLEEGLKRVLAAAGEQNVAMEYIKIEPGGGQDNLALKRIFVITAAASSRESISLEVLTQIQQSIKELYDPSIQLNALKKLRARGKIVTPFLVEELQRLKINLQSGGDNSRVSVMIKIIALLDDLKDPRAIPPLEQIISEWNMKPVPEDVIRLSAVSMLSKTLSDIRKTIVDTVAARQQMEAAKVDSLQPDEAVPLLMRFLSNDNEQLAGMATDRLTKLGSVAQQSLISSLGSGDPRYRVRVLEVLAAQGKVSGFQSMVPTVIQLLHDPDPSLRQAAIRFLGESGDRRASDPLLEGISSDTVLIGSYAEALRNIGDERLATILITRLYNRTSSSSAFSILASLGPSTIPSLADELKRSSNMDVKRDIVSLLGFISDPSAIPILKGCLSNEDLSDRARNALKMIEDKQ